jgi:hypothetical protein
MRTLRFTAPIAVAAALLAVTIGPRLGPPRAGARTTAPEAPVATLIGGSAAPPAIQSLVQTRIDRADAALERATTAVDQARPADAVTELGAAVSNMRKAWSGARFVIKSTPPPPVAGDGRVHARSGGGAIGPAVATPQDAALAVFGLQHDVLTTAVGLIDGVDPALAPTLKTAVSAVFTARNWAIDFIHKLPAPPVAGDGRVHARAGGGALPSSWATVMPDLVPQLDDEIQQAHGVQSMVTTSPVGLNQVANRATATKNLVNQYWPPIPAEG